MSIFQNTNIQPFVLQYAQGENIKQDTIIDNYTPSETPLNKNIQ